MKTTDIESLTNSVLQAIEKEFRKNDMGGAFHRQSAILRTMIRANVSIVVADHKAHTRKQVKK